MAPDTVLADNGIARVTRADYDLELTRLPPDLRGGFATNEKRVVDLINRLLVTKSLAAQADQAQAARGARNRAPRSRGDRPRSSRS